MPEEQKNLFERITDLLAEDNRHSLSKLLAEQRSSNIAEVIELLDNRDRRTIFDLLSRDISAEVFEKVDEATRSELFELFGEDELTRLIAELDPDDAADVLAEMPAEDSHEVLGQMPRTEAEKIKNLMSYSEDSAGGIMDPAVISVREDATVRQAIEQIRAAEIDEDFYSVFVVDKSGRFLGDVRIRLLITAPGDTTIKKLLNPDTIYVTADADQEHVRNLFKKNDLIVMPVLNNNHKLIGRITADRIIEVAEEEAVEDLYAMAGTAPTELETISILRAARVRMTWLLPCLIGTAVTALVMIMFKNVFASISNLSAIYGIIVAFVPMIAAISGNAGLQTSAIVVSGLATGDLAAKKISQVLSREVRVALLVAVCCGLIGGTICGIFTHSDILTVGTVHINPNQVFHLAVGFTSAMFSAIMVATTLGLLLPFVFHRIGIDPAISSGPLVTTANDSISVTIYLSLAMLLLK